MADFEIAHLHKQGQDIIIVPLNRDFGNKTHADQQSVTGALQACARAAGLRGTVVPVWDGGSCRMMFLAPQLWHSFFSSINLRFVASNINGRLTCSGR
jgi:hypothetical protein